MCIRDRLLFALGWSALGPWAANAAALAFCTLVNTALHRSLTRRSPVNTIAGSGRPSFALVIAVLYSVSLAATTAAIAIANVAVGPSLVAAAFAATIASCAAALLRFSLLRGWAFRATAVAAGSAAPAALTVPR